ncbi:hypothetical protein [Demequina sp. NBRC 110056]|uniref:hypothetical protein n=1 Tax=Demequina sp. NBRC 110056 TaxID=1570345 RepID=UPI000A03D483|nr:hypothetical protein [Demequina sp. NBRC 110056]
MRSAVDPTPQPVGSVDPFFLDPTEWPEAPGWLFPTVMSFLGVVCVVVVVLLFMWRRSIQYDKAERAAREPQEWVDLSKLGKGGRWADEESSDPRTREDFGRTKREEDAPE